LPEKKFRLLPLAQVLICLQVFSFCINELEFSLDDNAIITPVGDLFFVKDLFCFSLTHVNDIQTI